MSDIERLIAEGQKRLSDPRRKIDFETGSESAEILLNDLERYPHIFLLGCLMNRQIAAPLAWIIPYKIGKEIGGFQLRDFGNLSKENITTIFESQKLHRFNIVQAKFFHAAVQDIQKKYCGDASQIWSDKPRSGKVVRLCLEFAGVGVKIASMAANMLVRDFKVPMADYSSIDISPDRRVMRFFKEHDLLRKDGKVDELIYLARELNPEFPGLLDIAAWEGGAINVLKTRS